MDQLLLPLHLSHTLSLSLSHCLLLVGTLNSFSASRICRDAYTEAVHAEMWQRETSLGLQYTPALCTLKQREGNSAKRRCAKKSSEYHTEIYRDLKKCEALRGVRFCALPLIVWYLYHHWVSQQQLKEMRKFMIIVLKPYFHKIFYNHSASEIRIQGLANPV